MRCHVHPFCPGVLAEDDASPIIDVILEGIDRDMQFDSDNPTAKAWCNSTEQSGASSILSACKAVTLISVSRRIHHSSSPQVPDHSWKDVGVHLEQVQQRMRRDIRTTMKHVKLHLKRLGQHAQALRFRDHFSILLQLFRGICHHSSADLPGHTALQCQTCDAAAACETPQRSAPYRQDLQGTACRALLAMLCDPRKHHRSLAGSPSFDKQSERTS